MEALIIFLIILGLALILAFNREIRDKIYEINNKGAREKRRLNKIYEKELEKDVNFNVKINKIEYLIKEKKIRKIDEIANLTNSSLEECVLKIKYLENKKRIPNIHLNTRTNTLIECSYEDENLLKKYEPFLNNKNVNKQMLYNSTFNYDEFLYLYKKGLMPEIMIIEKTRTIIYLDKKKKQISDLITVICNNCGALNDVNRGVKSRCKYCNSVIDSINNNLK